MKITKQRVNILLAGSIALFATGLLIEQRINVPAQPTVVIDGTTYQRGESISSGDAFLRFHYAGTAIWLDKNTEVELLDGVNQPKINVIQGRIVTNGPVEIRTRDVHTVSDGQISYVHYSWLNQVDIASLNTASIQLPETTINLENQAIQLSTLPPYTSEPIPFTPYESVAADFYRFVDGE